MGHALHLVLSLRYRVIVGRVAVALVVVLLGVGCKEMKIGSKEGVERREETASKAAAVKKYPSLGVLDSDFNKAFRDRVAVLRKGQGDFFADPSWPERLADEIAAEMFSRGKVGEAKIGDGILQPAELRSGIAGHLGQWRLVQGHIRKIYEPDISSGNIRVGLDSEVEVWLVRNGMDALKGVSDEFLRWRLRVDQGSLVVKGNEGFAKANAVYFARDKVIFSEGTLIRVSGVVRAKGNRVWIEKAQMRSLYSGQ